MSSTHIPERTCIICRAKNGKSKLFRLAKVKEAFYEFDKEQKKQSRAVYVCKSLNCLGKLAKHNKVKLDSQDLMSMLNIINKANKKLFKYIKFNEKFRRISFWNKLTF